MILNLILAILATYRIARMLATEDGFFDLFSKLRELADPGGQQETWIARGVNCFHCLSFWVALVFAIALNWAQVLTLDTVLIWFGIAGAATLIHIWIER